MTKKRKIIIISIIVIALALAGLYQTFALSGIITTSGDTYNVTVSNNSTITVPANSTKTVYYKITNTNKGTVKYGVAYSGTNIKAFNYSDTPSPSIGTIKYGESKFVKLYLQNTGSSASSVTLSSVLGYENGGDLIVPTGKTLINGTLAKGSAGITINALGLTVNAGSPDFSKTSTADGTNGIYTSEDDQGISYYFRGDVKNNYFDFAATYWRIIRINSDGTIRMIYAGTKKHANGENDTAADSAVGTSTYADDVSTSSAFNFTSSNVYKALATWYSKEIDVDSITGLVKVSTFCSDTNMLDNISTDPVFGNVNSDDIVFSTRKRIFTDYNPTLKCNGTKVSSKYGLITADELLMAGAGIKNNIDTATTNKDFYLYSGYNYWTMSPVYYYGPESNSDPVAFIATHYDSALDIYNGDATSELYIRPVINLNIFPTDVNVEVTGIGTIDDPFALDINV